MSRTIASMPVAAGAMFTPGPRLMVLRSRRRTGGREIPRPEAQWLESAIHSAARVLRRPAGRVLEQTDGADPPVRTEVEPMVRAFRHANEIAGFDLDGEHRTLRRMNVEQAASFDDESDFVLVVP